jgi:hypothetical protein
MRKEHRDFLKYEDDYIDLSDFFTGERRVKEKEERYTPRLEGHTGKEGLYTQYVNFGILYNALSRTRQGLKGAILRKPIDIQFPETKKEALDYIMPDGSSFKDLARLTCDDVLGYGRCGVLVDISPEEKPYAAFYNSLSILSWPSSFNFSMSFGKDINQEIILQEFVEIPDPEDMEKTKLIEQRRKLEIDPAGYYAVSVYRKVDKNNDAWQLHEAPRYPTYKGKKLNFIPFVFFGSSSNIPSPSRPPLLDLLNLLKGHWRLTVAYQYGLHFAGLPTPCFAGFDFEAGAKVPLGPGAAYHTSEPNAKSWFLQTGGEGLASMERGLDRLEKQMAVVGARLLEEQRPGVEAAETVRLRSSGDSATLADIAGNVERGLTEVLQYIGFWLGIAEKECVVGVNKDFVSTRLGPQEITALLQAVQAGQMSSETFIWNLVQGEALSPGRTIEDEQEAIAEDKLITQRNNKNLADIGNQFLT